MAMAILLPLGSIFLSSRQGFFVIHDTPTAETTPEKMQFSGFRVSIQGTRNNVAISTKILLEV